MEQNPKPNEIYRHFKGNLYKVLTLAKHTETEEILVVYQALYGNFEVFARPLAEFVAEVDREKYPEVSQKYRFEKIPEGMGQMEFTAQMEAGSIRPQQDAAASASGDRPGENGGNTALLMEFLDAETYEEKLEALTAMRERLDDDMINAMAASLDVEVEEGRLEERYQSLKSCLLMLDRFECSRLR